MSRETIFKEGAWVGGYEYSNATQLTEDIAKHEADVAYYKAGFSFFREFNNELGRTLVEVRPLGMKQI